MAPGQQSELAGRSDDTRIPLSVLLFRRSPRREIDAWLRLVTLFAIALLVLTVLGTTLLLCAQQLLQHIPLATDGAN